MRKSASARGLNLLENAVASANSVILGKSEEIKLAFACLLARGHLLIEDLPGMGKTTMAHLIARLLGLQFSRIQFTSDLLPADVVGVSIFERSTDRFRFHPGPIFAQLVLADEINRATPKAQSALLEAMEERQVTVEGESRTLPEPFFVIATQNPIHQVGTFPLPESQLDRFLMRIRLGYPDASQEKVLLAGEDRRDLVDRQVAVLDASELLTLQHLVNEVHSAPPVIDYCHDVLQFTRRSERFSHGLSPRAGVAMLRAAKAWALLERRDYVIPEDVQRVLPSCVTHRLVGEEDGRRVSHDEVAALILGSVAVH